MICQTLSDWLVYYAAEEKIRSARNWFGKTGREWHLDQLLTLMKASRCL